MDGGSATKPAMASASHLIGALFSLARRATEVHQ